MNIELMNYLTQFRSAKGIKPSESIDNEMDRNFICWHSLMNLIKKEYIKDLLETLKIDEETKIYEVGKSFYDSANHIKLTGLITPYKIEDLYTNQDIIEGSLHIVKQSPYILTNEPKYVKLEEDRINRFITHNPYNLQLIKPWINIDKNYDISVSVFGKVYDKDKAKKVNELYEFSNDLNCDYEIIPISKDDNYCYILNTKKQKKL